MSDAMTYFKECPPVSRTLAVGAFVLSCLVYTGFISYYYMPFYSQAVFRWSYPQVWRIVTSFLLTAPKLSIIFDTYFLYTYSAMLERGEPRFSGPGDFLVYIIFVCSAILGLNVAFVGGYSYINALTMAMMYTWSQDNQGSQAHFFVASIPGVWLPYAFLAVTFITTSPLAAYVQASGIIAAHAYNFATKIYPRFGGGKNYIKTPGFVRRWFAPDRAHVRATDYGTMRVPSAANSSSASSTGTSAGATARGSWVNRGSGRRLGGE